MVLSQKNPPPTLLPAVQTLVKAKARINVLNTTLNTIKERLDRMEKIAGSETSGQAQIPEVFSSLFGNYITWTPQSNTDVKCR
jgi:hypothetical protein